MPGYTASPRKLWVALAVATLMVAACSAVSVGPVTGCWPCGTNSDPSCCSAGQFCPGQVPCCGTTSGGWSCNSTCIPQCTNRQCGDGGCTGSTACGTCPSGQGCIYNSQCQDCCEGRSCGPSPICPGVSCGSCPSGKGCSDGYCYSCCGGRECGPSSICPGVSCGNCSSSKGCANGYCYECCSNNECGMSAYCPGVSCGPATCPTGQGCQNNQCLNCCAKENACGTSWCPGSPNCGSCGTGNASSCYNSVCFCDPACQCGGVGCAGCPAASIGCNGCTCGGPRKNVKTISATNYVQMTEEGWTMTCNGAESCGGYTPLGPSKGANFSLSYNGDKGFYSMVSIIAIYETPDGKPLPGDYLYVYLGKGCVSGMTGCRRRDQMLNVDVSNCTFTNYTQCFSLDGDECFNNQGCPNAHVNSYTSLGNGVGVWVKNPKTSIFQLTYWVTDVYDGIYCSTNSNIATLLENQLNIQYSSD